MENYLPQGKVNRAIDAPEVTETTENAGGDEATKYTKKRKKNNHKGSAPLAQNLCSGHCQAPLAPLYLWYSPAPH